MRSIVVKMTLKAPIEKIFDLLADHANYHLLPGVKHSLLVRNGKPNKNGVGAIREITAGPAWFREEITAYTRPTRMDYLITDSRPPLEHRGGSIRLTKEADGTAVTWTSPMRVKIPLIGGLLTPLMARQVEKGIRAMLLDIERRSNG